MAELVDALVSNTSDSNIVGVQFPLRVLKKSESEIESPEKHKYRFVFFEDPRKSSIFGTRTKAVATTLSDLQLQPLAFQGINPEHLYHHSFFPYQSGVPNQSCISFAKGFTISGGSGNLPRSPVSTIHASSAARRRISASRCSGRSDPARL